MTPQPAPIHSHSSRLRLGRVSELGHSCVLTTVTAARRPVFVDFQAARAAVKCLRACDQQGWSTTRAFVLMPDHLHWMIVRERGDVSGRMRRFKSTSGHAVNEARRTAAEPLWQPRFHDRALRIDDDLRAAARYIVANPLRAELVTRVSDYPFWDCVWL